MEFGLLTVLGIGFLLGIRHTFDPDHIVAVTTVASRTGNVFKAALAGVFWGIGHSLTLFIIGVTLIAMKVSIPEVLALSFEMIVGIMLIILGWTTYSAFSRKKIHIHNREVENDEERNDQDHGGRKQKKTIQKSMLIGMIHGLAGSGSLVILVMSSMNTLSESVLYILVFGAGTILGMLIFAFLIGIPFVLLSKYALNIERKLGITAGIFSIAFGLFFMKEIAFQFI